MFCAARGNRAFGLPQNACTASSHRPLIRLVERRPLARQTPHRPPSNRRCTLPSSDWRHTTPSDRRRTAPAPTGAAPASPKFGAAATRGGSCARDSSPSLLRKRAKNIKTPPVNREASAHSAVRPGPIRRRAIRCRRFRHNGPARQASHRPPRVSLKAMVFIACAPADG